MAAVVSDASPLIALQQIGQLTLLLRLFGEVVVPPAVAREVTPSLPDRPDWIRRVELSQPIASEVLGASCGPGESEAISLALELRAEVVIVDERRARRLAAGLGIAVVGTAGILLRAKRTGFIPAVRPMLDQLAEHDFRLSPAIREAVLRDSGEADA